MLRRGFFCARSVVRMSSEKAPAVQKVSTVDNEGFYLRTRRFQFPFCSYPHWPDVSRRRLPNEQVLGRQEKGAFGALGDWHDRRGASHHEHAATTHVRRNLWRAQPSRRPPPRLDQPRRRRSPRLFLLRTPISEEIREGRIDFLVLFKLHYLLSSAFFCSEFIKNTKINKKSKFLELII